MPRRFVSILALSIAPLALAEQPKTDTKAPPSSADSGYELRGFFGTGDDAMASIRKKGDAASSWHKVGTNRDGVKVLSADPTNGIAKIEINKVTYTLRLAGEAPPISENDRVAAIIAKSKFYAKLDEVWKAGAGKKIEEMAAQAKREAVKAHPEWDENIGKSKQDSDAANVFINHRFEELMRQAEASGDKDLVAYQNLQQVLAAAERKADEEETTQSKLDGRDFDVGRLNIRTYEVADKILTESESK